MAAPRTSSESSLGCRSCRLLPLPLLPPPRLPPVRRPLLPVGKACVILPDSASSARWETADRPFLEQAFTAAGVESDIQNANGDKAKFATIADGMIAGGCSVMAIVNLDSEPARPSSRRPPPPGIPVIDYDRLTLGGGAKYYVSFDNVAVGTAIGEGLVKCLNDAGTKEGQVALLNGSPTDNNATLFKQGYEKAIKDAGYTIAADQSVPDWDNTKAGTIFEQMYTKANGDFVGVAAANDGLGGAVDRRARPQRPGRQDLGHRPGRHGRGPAARAARHPVRDRLQGRQEGGRRGRELMIALANGDTAAADALATGKTADSDAGNDVPSRPARARSRSSRRT